MAENKHIPTKRQDHRQKMGGRIKFRRDELNLDQKELTEHLVQLTGESLTNAAVGQWEIGKTSPTSDRLGGLAEILQTNPTWLLLGVGDRTATVSEQLQLIDKRKLRLVPRINLDTLVSMTIEEATKEAQENSELTELYAPCSDLAFSFIVRDRSNFPKVWAGDVISIDPSIEYEPGDYVLAIVQGSAPTDKEILYRTFARLPGNRFQLVPDNTSWETLEFDNTELETSVKIIGPMVAHTSFRRK